MNLSLFSSEASSKVADVRFGIKTGCNEFFILEDKTATAKWFALRLVAKRTTTFVGTRFWHVRSFGVFNPEFAKGEFLE